MEQIQIIDASEFKTIAWKNGKGETTELAVSEGGSVDAFDWRLSIATVTQDGPFSDFTGYWRNLVLIEGQGIDLNHDQEYTDSLREVLEFTTFDGGSQTTGTLVDGTIRDFNIMSKQGLFIPQVSTFHDLEALLLDESVLNFVYALEGGEIVVTINEQEQVIPATSLLRVNPSEDDNEIGIAISGRNLILISLYPQ